MSNCKKCNKKFHACSSCGMEHDWEYRYCSQKCWESSEEYSGFLKSINNVFDNLPKEFWADLELIVNDDNLYGIFDKVLESRRKNETQGIDSKEGTSV